MHVQARSHQHGKQGIYRTTLPGGVCLEGLSIPVSIYDEPEVAMAAAKRQKSQECTRNAL